MTECARERDIIAAVHHAWSSRPPSTDPSADAAGAESFAESFAPVLPEPLRAHVETCPACAEALTVARALLVSAAADADEPFIASQWLLVKAHVRERHLLAHRLERWHTGSVLGGAWALVLMVVFLIVPSLVSTDLSTLRAFAMAGLGVFVLTAAPFLWRWSHLES